MSSVYLVHSRAGLQAKFTTLTALKISSNSWLLKSWHICWTHLTWNEKSIIFISNRSNFTSYQGRDYINFFNFLHWYDPYDCLWGPPLKTAETSLAPSSNITIIMIIIIISSSSSYIIIMIILWLYIIIFIVEVKPVSQDIICTGEELNGGANTTLGTWLDIHVVARSFWERQRSAFFVRVCHLNADSCRDLKTRYSGNTKQRRSAKIC